MTFHPPIDPTETFYLPVGGGHELYVERVGARGGVPLLLLHGGPGAGASADMRRIFDPERVSAVLFDQRGAFRSRPLGSLDANTTEDLVGDIVRLRQHLGIPRWIVAGGSWGVALALAYAAREPDCVASLVLRGVYLGRRSEDLWQYQEGASSLLPDAWADFVAPIPPAERSDLIAAYHRRVTGLSGAERDKAALDFILWGLRTNSFQPDTKTEALVRSEMAASVRDFRSANLAPLRAKSKLSAHG